MTQWMHFLSRKMLTFIHLTYLIYKKNQITFQPYMISIKNSIKVVYMCFSLLQLACGSRDLFQAKKRISVM